MVAGIHWYTLAFIAIVLMGSGIVGAVIYAAISAYVNRRPRVACRVDTSPVFEDLAGAATSRSQITISDGQQTYSYGDLHFVQIHVENQSNQNFSEFKLGITLSAENVAIHIESQLTDRHHWVKQITPFSFSEPTSEIDLLLSPFNREEVYVFRLLVITNAAGHSLGHVRFSSPEAVHFVDMPTIEETVRQAAKSASLSVGPFKISFS